MTALDTGISLNMFYGDPGENVFISKMFREPYRQHFQYWFLNIVEQNREQQSFQKIISRLPEVCRHFFVKQWHEVPTEDQVTEIKTKTSSNVITYDLFVAGGFSSNSGEKSFKD